MRHRVMIKTMAVVALLLGACGGDKKGSCELTYAKDSADGSIVAGMQSCSPGWVASACNAHGTGADSVGIATKDYVFTAGATCEERGFKDCGRGAYYKDCTPPAKAAAAPAPAAPAPAAPVASKETCVGEDCAKQAIALVKSDPAKATAMFDKGCTDKHAISCAMVGTAYADGLGVTKDLARAAGYFQQSCDLGYAKGCYNVGLAIANGEGVPQDLPKAIGIMDKACTAGAWKACGSVGDYRVSTGDKAGAQPVLELGCKNGDALSCETLAKAFPEAPKPAAAKPAAAKPAAAKPAKKDPAAADSLDPYAP